MGALCSFSVKWMYSKTDIIPDDLLPHERGSLDQDDPCMPPVIYGL